VALSEIGCFNPAENLLDIGCGNGSQTEFFARHLKFCIGIDLQYSRLAGFDSSLRQAGILNISMIGGSAEQLPFQDRSFSIVTCFEMLEHVPDQQQTLREIWRVLKLGGTIILSVPHRWWIFETHGAILPLLPWNRVPFFSWLPKRLHDRWARARNYTHGEIAQILQHSGFCEIRTRLLTAPMDVVKVKQIQGLLRSTLFCGDTTRVPALASNIFAYAKKST
jgi:ubiquinone/menaquinone biosynthesis C-methylase UbiE